MTRSQPGPALAGGRATFSLHVRNIRPTLTGSSSALNQAPVVRSQPMQRLGTALNAGPTVAEAFDVSSHIRPLHSAVLTCAPVPDAVASFVQVQVD
jgi:hypothetical protein